MEEQKYWKIEVEESGEVTTYSNYIETEDEVKVQVLELIIRFFQDHEEFVGVTSYIPTMKVNAPNSITLMTVNGLDEYTVNWKYVSEDEQ